MYSRREEFDNQFPLWPYLSQPIGDPSFKLILNPWKFWRNYKTQKLEQCWQKNYIEFLESCWQKECEYKDN